MKIQNKYFISLIVAGFLLTANAHAFRASPDAKGLFGLKYARFNYECSQSGCARVSAPTSTPKKPKPKYSAPGWQCSPNGRCILR